MKKLVIIILFISLWNISYGQKQFKAKYIFCELKGEVKPTIPEIEIVIDYGDKEDYHEKTYLVDANGNDITFTSMVDALNYMGMHGWEFVQAFAITHGQTNVYHYLLKKPFEELNPQDQKLYLWD